MDDMSKNAMHEVIIKELEIERARLLEAAQRASEQRRKDAIRILSLQTVIADHRDDVIEWHNKLAVMERVQEENKDMLADLQQLIAELQDTDPVTTNNDACDLLVSAINTIIEACDMLGTSLAAEEGGEGAEVL